MIARLEEAQTSETDRHVYSLAIILREDRNQCYIGRVDHRAQYLSWNDLTIQYHDMIIRYHNVLPHSRVLAVASSSQCSTVAGAMPLLGGNLDYTYICNMVSISIMYYLTLEQSCYCINQRYSRYCTGILQIITFAGMSKSVEISHRILISHLKNVERICHTLILHLLYAAYICAYSK